MTAEPLWVVELSRYELPWCRIALQTGKPFTDIAHSRCPGVIHRADEAGVVTVHERCVCACHGGDS